MGESHIHGIVDGEAMDAMQIGHESNSCDKRRRLSWLANLGNCPKMPIVLADKSDELDLVLF